MRMPILSICIPTYNRLPYLKELMASLLPQVKAAGADVELLVSNNVSTDGTDAFCRGLECPSLRYWENETNIGGDRNFLKCIREACGEYVWLVGDDDLVFPEAVTKILSILKVENPGLLVLAEYEKASVSVYANYRDCLRAEKPPKERFAIFHTLISANVFRRTLFDMAFAEKTLHLSYAHMFGLMKNLGTEKVCVCPSLMSTRPVRADFAKYPSFLCVKHAVYLVFLAKTFGLPRYRLYAVIKACNLPMEFGSRIKYHLLKALAHV